MVILKGSKDEKPQLHLAFCLDAKYVPWFGVALTSILHNNPRASLQVHVLADDMPSAESEKLRRLADLHCICISIYDVGDNEVSHRLDGLRTLQHISRATYFRLFLPAVLPKEVQKLLYLDSDILVMGPITELYQTELGGFPLGAVEEPLTGPEYARRVGIPGKPYFNAGVLLIDLDQWRENGVLEGALDIVRRDPARMMFADQDALNGFFAGNFLKLPQRWNSFVNIGFPAMNTLSNESVIAHFLGPMKPWLPWYDGPLKDLYLSYVRRSMWADSPPVEPNTVDEAFAYASVLSRSGKHEEAARRYEQVARALAQEVSRLTRRT